MGVIVLLIVVLGTVALLRDNITESGPGKYDAFATCLKDQGAVFYGTFWCKFCNAQKKMFGSSQQLLPYQECSTADGRSQLQSCKDKNIASYPTWEFADNSRLNGVIPLEQLAEKTSCVLPTE